MSKSFPRVIRTDDGRRPCTMRCGNLCRGPICDLCRDALRAESIGAAAPRDLALSQMQHATAFIELAAKYLDPATKKLLERAVDSIKVAKVVLEYGHRRV